MSPINTFLYEKNPLLSAGIISHLKDSDYHITLGTEQLPQYKNPIPDNILDLLIYGVQCRTGFQEDLQAMKDHYQPCHLVVMSEDLGGDIMQQSLDVGADGLILKNITAQALIRYLDLVMMGEKIFLTPPLHTQDDDNHFNPASGLAGRHKLAQFQLTPREIQIVQCLTSA